LNRGYLSDRNIHLNIKIKSELRVIINQFIPPGGADIYQFRLRIKLVFNLVCQYKIFLNTFFDFFTIIIFYHEISEKLSKNLE